MSVEKYKLCYTGPKMTIIIFCPYNIYSNYTLMYFQIKQIRKKIRANQGFLSCVTAKLVQVHNYFNIVFFYFVFLWTLGGFGALHSFGSQENMQVNLIIKFTTSIYWDDMDPILFIVIIAESIFHCMFKIKINNYIKL